MYTIQASLRFVVILVTSFYHQLTWLISLSSKHITTSPIGLNFDMIIGSTTAATPIKFQIDMLIYTTIAIALNNMSI